MKLVATLFLALSLFTSAAIADDGHTGTGNRDGCTINCPPPCQEGCFTSGETGGLGVLSGSTAETREEPSFFEFWSDLIIDLVS